MKTVKQLFAALTVILLIAGGCGSSPSSKADQLDIAIRETSDYLNNNIPRGSKIVILNIQSAYPALSEYIIDELLANAVTDKVFTVVDRQQLDAIRTERDFQWSGEVNDKSAVEIGQIVGAQTIVSGAMSKLGNGYRMRIRALEVQTAQVQGQFNRNITSSPIVAALIESGGTTPTSGVRTAQATPSASATPATPAAPAAQAAPATPATPPRTAYRVGEAGPAGGLIFYDKGNNSNGWRYLEAAPVEVEFQRIKWTVHGTQVDGTQPTIGSGRRNTQLIVAKFRQTPGEWDTAAQKCDDLVFGEFDDWFLPSRDELDQMYGNLKRRNLGNFKNLLYLSSTVNDRGYVLGQLFADGAMETVNKIDVYTFLYRGPAIEFNHIVRPIRQVPGP